MLSWMKTILVVVKVISIDNLSLIRKIVFNLAKLDKSMGDKLTLKQKMTRYMSDSKNIENLIFNVIPYSDL